MYPDSLEAIRVRTDVKRARDASEHDREPGPVLTSPSWGALPCLLLPNRDCLIYVPRTASLYPALSAAQALGETLIPPSFDDQGPSHARTRGCRA